ncbi:MAG TPA: CHAD domain-containing protein, partial [Chitinophagaceae bacterium]
MIRKKIRRILKKKFKNLRSTIARIRKSFNSDDIHSFRLDVKKCTVLIDLIRYSGKNSNRYLLLPASLKKAYKILGGIRNFRIQEKKIQKEKIGVEFSLLNIYYDLLKCKELNLRKDAKNLICQHDIVSKKMVKNICARIKKQDIIQIDKFIYHNYREFDLLISKKEKTDGDYHSMRKLLKNIQYVQVLVKEKPTLYMAYSFRKNELAEITDKLGEYHDFYTTLTHLEAELPYIGSDGQDRSALMAVTQKWRTEKEVMR